MTRKILIVSPRFPPISAPDLHRVRTSLPYFRKFGWEPTVLCATPGTTDAVLDPDVMATVPADARIERVDAWPERACRRFGFGHFNYRCLVPLYRRGAELLASEHYDAVLFSTTATLTFVLGRLWKRRFGCAVVLDYQDPWYAGTRRTYDRTTAPGGLVKYAASRALGRLLEPVALRAATQLIAVSPGYIDALRADYPWLRHVDAAVIPFGAPFLDFERLEGAQVPNPVFDLRDGLLHWVYVGVVAPHMWPVLAALFRAVAQSRRTDPDKWRGLRMHFVGTSYASGGNAPRHVARLASENAIGDLVTEQTRRVPYMQALRILRDSGGVIVVGSVLGDYTPSKMFLCALSGRPVMALMNAGSAVVSVARSCPNVRVATFAGTPDEAAFGHDLASGLDWLRAARGDGLTDVREALDRHSAESLTRALCELLDRLPGPRRVAP